MSVVAHVTDAGEPPEACKVENVKDCSILSQNTTSDPENEEAILLEEATNSVVENNDVTQKIKVLTEHQISMDFEHDVSRNEYDEDKTCDKNLLNSKLSVQKEGSNYVCELNSRSTQEQTSQDQEEMDEIRENYFHQEEKEGVNDSKPKSCGGEADDSIEGMESDDTHRYQMFYLSLIY